MTKTIKTRNAAVQLILAVARSKLKKYTKVTKSENYVLNNQYFTNYFEVIPFFIPLQCKIYFNKTLFINNKLNQ